MNDLNNWERFYKLREKVFKAIRNIDDGYHKSYEGAMDVTFSFPDIFENKPIDEIELVTIELHCYLLCNGRHEQWKGKTFKEALDNASRGIENLVKFSS